MRPFHIIFYSVILLVPIILSAMFYNLITTFEQFADLIAGFAVYYLFVSVIFIYHIGRE